MPKHRFRNHDSDPADTPPLLALTLPEFLRDCPDRAESRIDLSLPLARGRGRSHSAAGPVRHGSWGTAMPAALLRRQAECGAATGCKPNSPSRALDSAPPVAIQDGRLAN